MAVPMRARAALILVAATALVMAAGRSAGAADTAFVSVGTGPVSGVYYPVGRALCDLVERTRKEHAVRCSVEPTVGSVYNLSALKTGELDLAIVQSDVQFDAYQGKGRWQGEPFSQLRSVLSLYPELVTIVARKDAGITDVEGLKGKRLDIGRPGSGAQATWGAIESAFGWTRGDLHLAAELPPEGAGHALCNNEIDASIQLVGHPSPRVAELLNQCDLTLVSVGGPPIGQLVAGRPYYRLEEIPAGTYGNNPAIPTFGGRATLVTSTGVPDPVIYAIAKAVLGGFDELKHHNPALARLAPEDMVRVALTAPLHPGAQRAYRELELIK